MPRTIRTKVYKFNELSKKSKETALTELYKSNKRGVKVIKHSTPMDGILVRITPEGANIYLPINGSGYYFDSVYWLPFEKIAIEPEYEFTKDGNLFHS